VLVLFCTLAAEMAICQKSTPPGAFLPYLNPIRLYAADGLMETVRVLLPNDFVVFEPTGCLMDEEVLKVFHGCMMVHAVQTALNQSPQ
jgi:hypothetical protein